MNVHRETLRRALSLLRLEGRIASRVGSGHYVERSKLEKDLTDLLSFTQWGRSMGKEPDSVVLRSGSFEAPKSVSKFLRVPLGTPIFHAVRLRRLDGEPLLLEYVYLSEAAFPGISDRALSSSSLYSVLEEEYGADLSVGQETISVTYVDAWEARNLRVSEGSPAFFVRSVVADGRGTPAEYCKSVIRSDRIRLVYHNAAHREEEA